ncbi:DoxX family protein [Haladaptatus sp. DYF46]|uniref:DoxX family protein n=1 Tax=Haladaptatus sp. DYF46 TaxID=2886041 RepID=UPI001E319E71|nr:DoxX family protein [Haladaptatus sp. DYF46]
MAERSDTVVKSTGFRVARLIYGGLLAYMGISGLRNIEAQAGYAEAKGVPMPEASVVASHWLLVVGGVGISLWKLPGLAASAAIGFLVGVTPFTHDFWNQEGQERQNEQNHFLKNAAMLGAAFAFLGIAESEKEKAKEEKAEKETTKESKGTKKATAN